MSEFALKEDKMKNNLGTYNEWGKLNEVVVGTYSQFVEPEYMPEFQWMSKESIDITRTLGGQSSETVLPDNSYQNR